MPPKLHEIGRLTAQDEGGTIVILMEPERISVR